jgi:hypothetical protein
MTLEEAREVFKAKQGQIKAFALHRESLDAMLEETGLGLENWHALSVTLFKVPVIIVLSREPEGVIV